MVRPSIFVLSLCGLLRAAPVAAFPEVGDEVTYSVIVSDENGSYVDGEQISRLTKFDKKNNTFEMSTTVLVPNNKPIVDVTTVKLEDIPTNAKMEKVIEDCKKKNELLEKAKIAGVVLNVCTIRDDSGAQTSYAVVPFGLVRQTKTDIADDGVKTRQDMVLLGWKEGKAAGQ